MEISSYDVIVIGAGGAGVTAALSAARAGARVALLSKEPLGCGNTRIAFGGVASVGLAPGDSPEEFFQDMAAAGEGLGRAPVTRAFTEEAQQGSRVAEGLGHLFRRDPEGETKGPAIGRAGGHRFRRGLSSPAQGVSLGGVLHNAALGSGVDLLEETLAFRLLGRGWVQGVMAFSLPEGRVLALGAGAVVLACGGAGHLYYPHTDCVRAATGDGYALALEAGAELLGMEFMQFLPFAVTHPSSYCGIFLGEPSSSGPHGRLVNGKGQTVLSNMESMTRAQVARVQALEMAAGNTTVHGGLSLDLSPNLESAQGRQKWRNLGEIGFLEQARAIYGERAYRWEEPWDVAPTAHFTVGGVRVDEGCRTTLPGLYAAGEVAGGVHGADRLGGTALAEAFLFGWKAGAAAASHALGRGPSAMDLREARRQTQRVEALLGRAGRHRPIALVRSLQKLMWEHVGLVRNDEGLGQALEGLDTIEREAQELWVRPGLTFNSEVAEALELGMMLTTARAMALAALERRESRGGHLRLDYPQQDDRRWLKNLIIWKKGDALRLRSEAAGLREARP